MCTFLSHNNYRFSNLLFLFVHIKYLIVCTIQLNNSFIINITAYRKSGTQDPERTQDPMRTQDSMRTQDPTMTQDPMRTQDPRRTKEDPEF